MRTVLIPIVLALAAALPQTAVAQRGAVHDAAFFDCRNDRIRVAIAPMPLEKALATFTDVTRCPVSLDTDKVKGRPTRSMRTALTKGRFTPEQALARMLRTTPLKGRMIHGGFSVAR